MGRTNYTSPRYIERSYDLAQTVDEIDPEILKRVLQQMANRHDSLLHDLHRTIDNYNQLLEAHGPYHEVELGEPLSRFENILRKALNDSQ